LFVIIIIHACFTYISQGSIYSFVEYIITILLQTVNKACQRKNFENRSIIGEDKDKSKVPRFLAHPLVTYTVC